MGLGVTWRPEMNVEAWKRTYDHRSEEDTQQDLWTPRETTSEENGSGEAEIPEA
jgi:hypothetical protein